jgi:L-ascorbate metabolism protein UlaG (beta-lactamase superfamily)
MKVTYIYHSGFLVETESATLLFDYYKGELPAFPDNKPLVIFASHKHPDHFDFRIFKLQNHPGGVVYVFGNDIKLSDNFLKRHGVNPMAKEKIYRMQPHKTLTFSVSETIQPVMQQTAEGAADMGKTIVIHTLKSTDAGVAFYVKIGKERIYHAGDLNWWHWEGETETFNLAQEKDYKAEIAYLKALLEKEVLESDKTGLEDTGAEEAIALDVAFLTLDPRLGDAYRYGMDYFLSQISVKRAYPMHMWEDT